MESLTTMIADRLLDPVVIVPALAVNAALISGLAARAVERWEDRRPRANRSLVDGRRSSDR